MYIYHICSDNIIYTYWSINNNNTLIFDFLSVRTIVPLDEKNNSDQTYSCPRDLRLSASWGPLKPLRQPQCYRIERFKGAPQLGSHFAVRR